jgi:hypothetical protein
LESLALPCLALPCKGRNSIEVILCCTSLSAVFSGPLGCSAVQCSAVQCSSVQCSAVQCSVQFTTCVPVHLSPVLNAPSAACQQLFLAVATHILTAGWLCKSWQQHIVQGPKLAAILEARAAGPEGQNGFGLGYLQTSGTLEK